MGPGTEPQPIRVIAYRVRVIALIQNDTAMPSRTRVCFTINHNLINTFKKKNGKHGRIQRCEYLIRLSPPLTLPEEDITAAVFHLLEARYLPVCMKHIKKVAPSTKRWRGPAPPSLQLPAQSPPLDFLRSSLSSASLLWTSLCPPPSRCLFSFFFFSCAGGRDQASVGYGPGGNQARFGRGPVRIRRGRGRRAFLCFFFFSCFSSLCFLSTSSSESLLSLSSELLSLSRFFFSFFSFFSFCGGPGGGG